MLISVSSFGKSELEIPAGDFYSGCVRNVLGAAFFAVFQCCSFCSHSQYREVQNKIYILVFYIMGNLLDWFRGG